jgi:hypothetical protein
MTLPRLASAISLDKKLRGIGQLQSDRRSKMSKVVTLHRDSIVGNCVG